MNSYHIAIQHRNNDIRQLYKQHRKFYTVEKSIMLISKKYSKSVRTIKDIIYKKNIPEVIITPEIPNGSVFGKYTVVRYLGNLTTSKNGKIKSKMFLCRCHCGNRKKITIQALKQGVVGCNKCHFNKMKKPFDKLSRERMRQLRRERLGLCKRKCDEAIFKSGFCEVHYQQEMERKKRVYKIKSDLKKIR